MRARKSAQNLLDGLDVHHGQDGGTFHVRVAQGDVLARLDLLGKRVGNVQRDRHRPEHTTRQTHVVNDAFVLGPGQKTFEW